MTRIYQLDTIDQEDISSSHVFPAEDSGGIETVQMSLRQLGRYLFCAAGSEGEGALFEGQNLVIGNQSYAIGNYCSAVGPYNDASNDGDPNTYASAFGYDNEASGNWGSSAFGYRNYATYSQASAFGHKNTASDRHASAFGSDNEASGEASLAVGYNNVASGYGNTAVGYSNSTEANCCATAVGYNNTAEGGESNAFGHGNTAQGGESNAIGWDNDTEGGESSAIGCNNYSLGRYSLAIGYSTSSLAIRSSAIGYRAITRCADTVNFGGAIVARGYNGEEGDAATNFAQFSGVQNVVLTVDIDFTTTGSNTLTVPSGCRFYVDEVSILIGQADTVSSQPSVKFGWTEDDDGIVGERGTTNLLTAGSRESFGASNTDGVQSLLATVTVAGTATTLRGRVMWKGVLVENTPIENT